MQVWDILGIEYTKDLKKIREAYAEKAKEVHPEEHPKEFTELRNAYKQAIQIAKDNREDEIYSCTKSFTRPVELEIDIIEENQVVKEEPSVDEKDIYDYGNVIFDESAFEEQYEEFIEKFGMIYYFSITRNNVKAWAVIMENPMYSELFTIPKFLNELANNICRMEYVNKKVYEYMIGIYKRYDYVPGADALIDEITWAMEDVAHENHIDRMTDMERILVQKITGKYTENADYLEGYDMKFFVTRMFKLLNELDGSKQATDKFVLEYDTEKYLEEQRMGRERLFGSPFGIFCIIALIIIMIMSCVNGGYSNTGSSTKEQESRMYYNQDTGRFEIKYY